MTPAFVRAACPSSSSNHCLLLGQFVPHIERFFGSFSFDRVSYTSPPTIRLVSQGSTGSVCQVTFQKQDVSVDLAVKVPRNVARDAQSDSLLYEYVVGQDFVNPLLPYLPCFVHTFDVYSLPSSSATATDPAALVSSLVASKQAPRTQLAWHAPDAWSVALTTSFVQGARTLLDCIDDHVQDTPDDTLWRVGVVYQVYAALAMLGPQAYNHRDLHADNVIVSRPFGDDHVFVHYHFESGRTVCFPTSHLATLFDYGRSYFDATHVPVLRARNAFASSYQWIEHVLGYTTEYGRRSSPPPPPSFAIDAAALRNQRARVDARSATSDDARSATNDDARSATTTPELVTSADEDDELAPKRARLQGGGGPDKDALTRARVRFMWDVPHHAYDRPNVSTDLYLLKSLENEYARRGKLALFPLLDQLDVRFPDRRRSTASRDTDPPTFDGGTVSRVEHVAPALERAFDQWLFAGPADQHPGAATLPGRCIADLHVYGLARTFDYVART